MTLGDFSEQAGIYGAARPGYPQALVQRLVGRVGLCQERPVVEVGAGTGIFARQLVAAGARVIAIEPNAEMRRQIQHDSIECRDGSFERTGLEDGCTDWVVAAQAFHWADPSLALPELRRILRSGGCFTALWNDRDRERSPLLQWTASAIQTHVPEMDEGYRDQDWGPILLSTGDFERLDHEEERHVVSMSPERYLALWKSRNRLAETAGPQRLRTLLAAIEEHLRENYGDQELSIPYVCRAWTAWT